MLTEQDKIDSQKKKIELTIRQAEEVMAKSEKYERLKENKDWQSYIEDLKLEIGRHEKEILLGITYFPDAPSSGHIKHDASGAESYVSSKSDWMEFINRHEIQRAQLQSWVKEPDYIISAAQLYRDRLPILKEKLSELAAVREPVVNGKE